MIQFFDKEGNCYSGTAPYIHWFDGGQSTDLQYVKSIFLLSNYSELTFTIEDPNSKFRIIFFDDAKEVEEFEDGVNVFLSKTIEGAQYGDYFAYQLLVKASSDVPGQCTEVINIEEPGEQMIVGADFYELDEIIKINLGNRGTEIPETIQKAIYENNIREANIDAILVNRKFKELITNYLDIMDGKGSYDSLVKSLKWFEWGKHAQLLEVWKNNEGYFEKELENILSEEYQDLIYTHQKTNYLAIRSALYELTNNFDEEKNPVVVRDPSLVWSNDEMGLKVSLLGAFFERYFMPIHLTLKRASVEDIIFTPSIKILTGTLPGRANWFHDDVVVDIDMDHTVVLGEHEPIAVSKDTFFASTVGENGQQISPADAGVQPLDSIELYNDDDEYPTSANEEVDEELGIIWSHIRGGVGVVVPIKVTIPIPRGDGISAETLYIKRTGSDPVRKFEQRYIPSRQITVKKYDPETGDWVNVTIYACQFTFYLFSDKEETVEFSLQLHSLSGHTYTACSGYDAIDTRGSYIDILKVDNKVFDGIFEGDDPWATWNPWEGMIDNGSDIDPNDINYSGITQYITKGPKNKYLNEFIALWGDENGISGLLSNSYVENNYYVLKTDTEVEGEVIFRLIGKQAGILNINFETFCNRCGVDYDDYNRYLKKFDHIFVPQLHTYNDIAGTNLNDYTINPLKELICLRPQFKCSKPVSSWYWKLINKSKISDNEIVINQASSNIYLADIEKALLDNGYWTVELHYRFSDDIRKEYTIKRDSAILIKNSI